MPKGNYNNRVSKFIAGNKVNVKDVAKSNLHKLCDCPNSEPGKVKLDIQAHQQGCHIRKKLQTGQFTITTSVTPRKIRDGYCLGVVLGETD
jgi:hypothetical protein